MIRITHNLLVELLVVAIGIGAPVVVSATGLRSVPGMHDMASSVFAFAVWSGIVSFAAYSALGRVRRGGALVEGQSVRSTFVTASDGPAFRLPLTVPRGQAVLLRLSAPVSIRELVACCVELSEASDDQAGSLLAWAVGKLPTRRGAFDWHVVLAPPGDSEREALLVVHAACSVPVELSVRVSRTIATDRYFSHERPAERGSH